MSASRFSNKVAIVTGGSRGIGKEIARLLFEEGAKVAVCSNDGVADNGAYVKLHADSDTGAVIRQYAMDMRYPSDIEAFVSDVAKCLGPPLIIINNAAATEMFHSAEATLDDFQSCIDVNLRGYWYLARTAYPYMKERQCGTIVNIGSMHAYQTRMHSFPYNVSKGAVLSLNRALALDFGPAGIRVNAVLPGIVDTKPTRDWVNSMEESSAKLEAICNSHALLRMPTVAEVANAVLFLASDAASGITGSEIVVDAGRSIKRSE